MMYGYEALMRHPPVGFNSHKTVVVRITKNNSVRAKVGYMLKTMSDIGSFTENIPSMSSPEWLASGASLWE